MPQAVYKNTPQNRKLKRVGKPFGDPKYRKPGSKPPPPKKPAYDPFSKWQKSGINALGFGLMSMSGTALPSGVGKGEGIESILQSRKSPFL